jgi:osmoprotectant transport system permease protein
MILLQNLLKPREVHWKIKMPYLLKTILIVILTSVLTFSQESNFTLKVGSKKFTENVIAGELAFQLAKLKYNKVEYLKEIGGTRILWNALLKGDINIYPEYTGTLKYEILAGRKFTTDSSLKNYLEEIGIEMSKPLGFNNTYALGMKKEIAEKLGVKKISDLQKHVELKFGFSNEFMDRNDGWPGLKGKYNLPQKSVNGLDHDIAYRGLDEGSIDVIDLYSTDAEITYYDLKVLDDDLNYFPEYKAVILYRKDLPEEVYPAVSSVLMLEGNITGSEMTKMNALVKIDGFSEEKVASDFIKESFSIKSEYSKKDFFDRLAEHTVEHLFLVLISLSSAIFFSIPLGVFSYRNKKVGNIILGGAGVIQTIPSLALLVFMIPLLGIGSSPAIFALFLYSLLPIIRNTYSGLQDIPSHIKESALALGLPDFARLRLIELPLASRSILAGIKTSAVINVGTATLGALIGAGGYGQPILTGIRLDSISLILEGAIPAALLALIVQWMFDLLEVIIVPKGLRL